VLLLIKPLSLELEYRYKYINEFYFLIRSLL